MAIQNIQAPAPEFDFDKCAALPKEIQKSILDRRLTLAEKLNFHRSDLLNLVRQDIRKLPPDSFVGKIFRYHKPDKHPDRAVRRTINSAIRLLTQNKALVPEQRRNFSDIKNVRELNQTGEALLLQRNQNLMHFYAWLKAHNPELEEHFPNIFGSEKDCASQIRDWFRNMPDALRANIRFHDLTLEEIYNLPGIPKETLTLNLSAGMLGDLTWIAALKGEMDFINKLIESPRFNAIDHRDLGLAFWGASGKGHLSIVQALMESPRFNEISGIALERALRVASEKGHLPIVQALIASPRFNEIPGDALEDALSCASAYGHLPIVQALIASPRFHEIPGDALGIALIHASKRGHLGIVQALLNSGRKDIPSPRIAHATLLAAVERRGGVFRELINKASACFHTLKTILPLAIYFGATSLYGSEILKTLGHGARLLCQPMAVICQYLWIRHLNN